MLLEILQKYLHICLLNQSTSNQASFWSLSGQKEPKLPKMPFVSQALWSLLFLMLYTGFSSVGMHTEISKIPCSFTFLAPFFSLFFFPFSSSTSFAGHLLGTIFFGNGFGQTFGIVGLDGRKYRCVMEKRFSFGIFRSTFHVFFHFSLVCLTEYWIYH